MPFDGTYPHDDGGQPRRPHLNHTAYCRDQSGRDVIFAFGWLWDAYETPQEQACALLRPGEVVCCVTPGCYGPGRAS